MKKRSIGILLLGLAVCTCISGAAARVLQMSMKNPYRQKKKQKRNMQKNDVVIKEPEEKSTFIS